MKEAVSKSLITQAQADEITANGLPTRMMRVFGRPGSTGSIDYNALLANALGITTDQLKAAQQQVEDAHLADAVANGQMTQEQADLLKARQALYADSKFQSSMQSAYELDLSENHCRAVGVHWKGNPEVWGFFAPPVSGGAGGG